MLLRSRRVSRCPTLERISLPPPDGDYINSGTALFNVPTTARPSLIGSSWMSRPQTIAGSLCTLSKMENVRQLAAARHDSTISHHNSRYGDLLLHERRSRCSRGSRTKFAPPARASVDSATLAFQSRAARTCDIEVNRSLQISTLILRLIGKIFPSFAIFTTRRRRAHKPTRTRSRKLSQSLR